MVASASPGGPPENVSAGYGPAPSCTANPPMRPATGRRCMRPYMTLFSIRNTGSSSSTAALTRACRSWHSLVATTRMFGTPTSIFSSDWLWVGP